MVHTRWCKTIPSYVLCQLYLREENDWMGRQWHERSIHCVICRCWLCGMCTIFEVHIRFSYAYSGETYSVSVSWWKQTPGVCEPFYTWSWDRSRWCNPSNNGSSCTQYLGNAYRIFSQAVVSWWQPRDDWCGSFWKKSNNAAFGKDSWNFYYVIAWAFQQRSLCSHVWDHSEDGRGHPHKRFYKPTCLEKGMHVDQSFGTRRPWFEAIGRPSAAHYGCWHYSSSSFSVKDRWGSQFSIYWNTHTATWGVP